jgi:6,7-dimethyl-8-ribityllumazine synthase
MLQTQNVDAVIAIGCYSEQTKHFDFVWSDTRNKDLNVQSDIPVILCSYRQYNATIHNDRSGGIHGNKGTGCYTALLKMAFINKHLWHIKI